MSPEAPEVLTSSRLNVAGIHHGFLTRRGGVSRGIYESLNLGLGSDDDPEAVRENYARAAAAFGLGAQSLCIAYQTHSAVVHVADQPFGEARPRGDGVATRTPGLLCGALAADCAPVLMADPEARVVSAVHAGWRGALAGVIEAGVAAMASLGARPDRILAAIGPCIGPASYQVGPEFLEQIVAECALSEACFTAGEGDRLYFDLPAYALSRLERAGVGGAEWIGADTYADAGRFYSNRRALHQSEPDFGRLLSAIALV